MGSPIGVTKPKWLYKWLDSGYKLREANYYNQLYIARAVWANQIKILSIYRQCKRLRKQGMDVVVDHVIPMNSPYVSGLMCEDNLQIITSAENSKKSNHTWPDSWEEQLTLF